MTGAANAGWSLEHPLLSRPRPRRSHRPSRTREVKTTVLRSSALDLFFPTVSEARHDGSCDRTLPDAPEVDMVIPQHWCRGGVAGAPEHISHLSPSPRLAEEEHHEKTWTDLGAGEAGGDPPDDGDDDGDDETGGDPPDDGDDDGDDEAGGDPPDDGGDDGDDEAGGGPPDDGDDGEAGVGPPDGGGDDGDDEAGGGPPDGGEEYETTEEEATCWQEQPAGGHQYDGRRIIKTKASDEDVRRQIQEEGDSGIITARGRSVPSLAAFLENMYMASGKGVLKDVVEELCTEDGDDSAANNFTNRYDSLAEFISSAGDEPFSKNSLDTVDSPEVDFPGQVGSHKSESCKVNSPNENDSPDCIVVDDSSPDTGCVTSVDFSSETNSSPKAVFPAAEPPAKCDFPSDGYYIPLSRGSAAAGNTDDPAEPAAADLFGLDFMASVIKRDERIRLRRHLAEDADLSPFGNCVNEIFGSTRRSRIPKDSGFDLRNVLGKETEILGKQLNEEAVTLTKLKDEGGKYRRKFSDAVVTLRKPLTEDTVRVRSLSENRLPFRRPLNQEALTLKEPPSEGTVAFERLMSEESCESFRKIITEDFGSSSKGSTAEALILKTPSTEETGYTLRCPMTEGTEIVKQPITQENSLSLGKSVIGNTLNTLSPCTVKAKSEVDYGKTTTEGGTTNQVNYPAEEENIHDFSQNESSRENILTLNAREHLTESLVNLGNYGAKGKQGKGNPPPKPPRTYAEAQARPPAGAVNNSSHLTPPAGSHLPAQKTPHKSEDEDAGKKPFECGTRDEREVAEGPSLQDGDDQTSTPGRVEDATVKNSDIKELSGVDQSEPLVSPERHNAGLASYKVSSRTLDDLSVLHNLPIQSVVYKDKLNSPKCHDKIKRVGCVKSRSGELPASSPGAGTLPRNLPKGTKRVGVGVAGTTRMPQKPPRPSLWRNQDTCPEHGGALKYYCAKCRVVICRECEAAAHQQQESHRVLDTPNAVATLRTEAVTFLKHYTLLRSLHGTLADTYRTYIQGTPQNNENETIALWLRLEDDKVLQRIVQEAEVVVSCGINLRMILERVKEWEGRQHEWGDLVYLAHRRSFLANVTAATDKVYLRVGDWVMPTPWIQLSHLLQPYLEETLLPARDVLQESPPARSASPRSTSSSPSRVRMCSGAKEQHFPSNARQVLLSSLIPYIIFNPDIRYFIHVSNHRDLDLTMVVVPAEDHSRDYLKRRLRFANVSPAALRRNGFTPSDSSLMTVEKLLMMGGRHHTHLTASYMTVSAPGATSASVMVKVSFPDIAVAAAGHVLALSTGTMKRGELVLDQDSNGRYILALAVRDVEYVPALRLGHVVVGLDGFTYLIEAEDKRRSESSGFRNKILSTVRREEAIVYQVTFGMDL